MVRQLRILASQFRVLRTGTLSEIRPDNMYQPLGASLKYSQIKKFIIMEKPLFEYKNRLRNSLIIGYWIVISIGFFSIMVNFLEETNYNSFGNFIVIVVDSLITMLFIWPFKRIKMSVYIDAIVLKENGWHPQIEKEFGIIFENIYDYKIKEIVLTFYWIEFRRRNGKTIRRLFSLSKNELKEFSKILNDKKLKASA